MTFFGFWRRKAAIPRRNPGARPVDVERKHEKAERVRRDCPRCNPTARAMELVRMKWIAAGIDLGE